MVKSKLAKDLKEIRGAAGLSQRSLAEKAGIERAQLSAIEVCKWNPTIETLEKIAKGLGKKLEVRFK
jgi:transcriptional regulator with XRE-family HTH domain